jgi:hypothetical protein
MITNIISNINVIVNPNIIIEYNSIKFILTNGLKLDTDIVNMGEVKTSYFNCLLRYCIFTENLLEYIIDNHKSVNWFDILNKYRNLSGNFILKYLKNNQLKFDDLFNELNYFVQNDYLMYKTNIIPYNIPIECFEKYPEYITTKVIAAYLQIYGLEYGLKLKELSNLNNNIFYYLVFINLEKNVDTSLCYKYKLAFSLACNKNSVTLIKYLCKYPNNQYYDLKFITYILDNKLDNLKKICNESLIIMYIIMNGIHYENRYTLDLFKIYNKYIIINDYVFRKINNPIKMLNKYYKWYIPEELIDLYIVNFKQKLNIILMHQKLSCNFLQKYFKYFTNPNQMSKYQSLTEEFIVSNINEFDFDLIICRQSVSEKIIISNIKKCNVQNIIKFQSLSEAFIEKYIELNDNNLKLIFKYQLVSDYFICKYNNKKNIKYVIRYQCVSEHFIFDNIDNIDCIYLLQYVKLSDEMLLSIVNYYSNKYINRPRLPNIKNYTKLHMYSKLINYITDPNNCIDIPLPILYKCFIPNQLLLRYLSNKIAYPKPEWFLIKNKELVNWDEATKYPLHEELIKYLLYHENNTCEFRLPYISNIYKYSKLSIDFMNKHQTKLYYPDVILYQKPAAFLINKYLEYLNDHKTIFEPNDVLTVIVNRISNWYKFRSNIKKINYLSMCEKISYDNKTIILSYLV